MEVIPSRSGGSESMPFQRHNVEEWSRLDSLSGMLEHARVETGLWTANTSTSSQQYGKVRIHKRILHTIIVTTIIIIPLDLIIRKGRPMACEDHVWKAYGIIMSVCPQVTVTEFHGT
jgi:hypothetical protein